jgi:hypothetical protein
MSKEIDGNVRELISDGRRNDMHKWLSPADPSTNYNKALRIRHRASGQWFLQSTTYLSWKAEAGRSLWLKGKAGCGKTILSSTIIENLKKASSSTATLLYFYFDFGDVGKQALECALRSLIYQLYCETPGVQNGLDSLYSSCHAGQSQPTIDSLMAAFQGMLDLAGDVQIVLDALDECPARNDDDGRGLLPWIKTIHDRKDVWLLTTSRPEQDIECSMNWVGTECTIDLESSLVHADICSFIRDKVYSDSTLRRWHGHPEIQEEVEKVLFAKADGMYEYSSL